MYLSNNFVANYLDYIEREIFKRISIINGVDGFFVKNAKFLIFLSYIFWVVAKPGTGRQND